MMEKFEIINLIENKYLYYDYIKTNLMKTWNFIKQIDNKEEFFEQLYLFLNNQLDPHTKLIDRDKFNYILPIYFTEMNNRIVVTGCLDEYSKVINPGDVLTHINGIHVDDYIHLNNIDSFDRGKILELIKIIENISYSKIQNKIKLRFQRKNYNFEVLVFYGKICNNFFDSNSEKKNKKKLNYSKLLDGEICYIRLPNLNNDILVKEAIAEIRNKGKKYYIILDIRNNMGGKIDLATSLTSVFLEKNTTIYLKTRNTIETLDIISENNYFKYPVTILFNNMTASSLEYVFLNQILKNDRILLLGNKTAGMKDIATVLRLNDRYNLILTTKKYVDHNGRSIVKNCISPDIEIPTSIKDFIDFPDKQLLRAIDILRKR